MFRVYDNEEKKYSKENFAIEKDGTLLLKSKVSGVYEPADPDRYIVEEGTGLKDKNGVDIFEGDILKGGIYLEYDVRWDYYINGWNFGCADLSKFEVIGNKHKEEL